MTARLNGNKTSRQNSNRKIIAAINAYVKNPVNLSGVSYAPQQLVVLFQTGIDTSDATDKAHTAWQIAVDAERTNARALSGIQAGLRHYVLATYGAASPEAAAFGFTPKTPRTVTSETKANAAKKRVATREARHTMGVRQKQDVKGEVAPAAAPAPNTPSQPGGALHIQLPAQLNGVHDPAKA
jgi:hypothetical protein